MTPLVNSHLLVLYSSTFVYCTQDCSWLTEFIARSPLLRQLEIHRSRVDDTRLLLLANALIDHPSLTEIKLPYNVLGDDAARILARHVDHTGRRVRLVSHIARDLNQLFMWGIFSPVHSVRCLPYEFFFG